jgi:hypothetical protein
LLVVEGALCFSFSIMPRFSTLCLAAAAVCAALLCPAVVSVAVAADVTTLSAPQLELARELGMEPSDLELSERTKAVLELDHFYSAQSATNQTEEETGLEGTKTGSSAYNYATATKLFWHSVSPSVALAVTGHRRGFAFFLLFAMFIARVSVIVRVFFLLLSLGDGVLPRQREPCRVELSFVQAVRPLHRDGRDGRRGEPRLCGILHAGVAQYPDPGHGRPGT